MKYISTRDEAASPIDFKEVLLGGIPTDGGLFVPEAWPTFSDLAGDAANKPYQDKSYQELATDLIHPFVEQLIPKDDLTELVEASYKTFSVKEVTPLQYLEAYDIYLLELFHGPTLAFKDIALQLTGNLFEYVLNKQNASTTIITATSGDTGAAAIYGCLGKNNLNVVVLHPYGRVSEIQRKMMTCVDARNVKNIAVEGNFDDCQKLVKQLFADPDMPELAAMNSINWARIAAQVVYYFYAIAQLKGMSGLKDGAEFIVPSGNFGNIYAGWVAKQMGAPIKKLTAAVNKNNTLAHFLTSGRLETGEASPTLAPAMDVSVPSNLERLVFEILGRSGKKTKDVYSALENGEPQNIDLDEEFQNLWSAQSVSDEEIKATIKKVKSDCGIWIDPHSAVGVAVALSLTASTQGLEGGSKNNDLPKIVLATAHPAKFLDLYIGEDNDVGEGEPPVLPETFSSLETQKEHYEVLPAEYSLIKETIF